MLLQYKPLKSSKMQLYTTTGWALIIVSLCGFSHSSSTTMPTNGIILPMGAQSPFPSHLRGTQCPACTGLHSAIPRGCTPCSPGSSLAAAWSCSVDPKARPLPNPWGSKHVSKGVAKVGLCEEAPSSPESLHEEPCIFLPHRVWELSTLIPSFPERRQPA